MSITYYTGPAGVVFSPDELLIIWKYLATQPTEENRVIRDRVKRYLEERASCPTS